MKKPSTSAPVTHFGITLGLDLGDLRHSLCALDPQGVITEETTIGNDRDAFRRLAVKYPEARVIIEVGTQSPWISRFLSSLGMEVLVANARKLRAIYQSDSKSDRKDAQTLARIGRFDPQLLHPIAHRSEAAQRDLLHVKLRDTLVRQRNAIILSVRFTLKSLGHRLPSPNPGCFAKRARTLLTPELLRLVEPMLKVLDTLSEQIREMERRIGELCRNSYPETQRLQAINGVGPITALTFLLTVDDPRRFAKPRDIGPWLGLTPKRDQSGKLDKELPISKAGDKYLRRLLVSCAQYILGPFGRDCDLRNKGLALAERGGHGAKKKAVIATARKLAVVMQALLQQQGDYHPQRETGQQQAA
jgi:transposase